MDIGALSKADRELVSNCFLFAGARDGTVERVLSDDFCKLMVFKKGDILFDNYDYRQNLALILSGGVEVKKSAENRFIMHRLTGGSFFGAADLFEKQKDSVTVLVAYSDCRVVFFSLRLLQSIMRDDFTVADNYIKFLSGRIRFLNEKISGLTAESVEATLARYLVDNAKESGEKMTVVPGRNISALAEELNIGRASLYRAFDALSELGCIKKTGKKIEIVDINKLKGI